MHWADQELSLLLEIVRRSDDVKGFTVPPRRWVVEKTFRWLVRNSRLARDYERLTACSEAMIKVAMIRLMAARLAGHKTHGPAPPNAKHSAASPCRTSS